ncbi:p53-like transcription factor [Mucor lusitanicus]|uniref:p53-like transcription factor n=2 Tax=Mucor circinelloides f. lusitanicus TaxID=29924 RepID=A0A168I1V7_MUCCL|nr:p53-like transcription factor [Mucor lusitanicus]OAC99448.1 p53-like transcription factor [Mucor lusitanicus CBS 277.49]
MTSYIPLPYSSYNGEYQPQSDPSSTSETSSQPVLPVSPPLQQGLMSISQPETPRPDSTTHTPPPASSASASNDKLAISPNLIRRRPPLPLKHANFTTTTFHSNPYPSAGPIRRRRTESIFSFEMGPAFTSTKQLYDLYSMDQSNSYQVQLHAKMDRGFFRADQDWTCYRRNYFQVSSTFDVHGMNYMIQGPEVPCLLRKSSDSQELLQVDYFSIGVCARVTNNDKKIELVQHTPKRDKGPQMIPEPRPVRAGGNLHLASVGSNHNIVTFERLQFKTATANNGKRRAAQQYYEIVVDLYANFAREEPLRVATCVSAPLVVRGRSPGHYADSHTRFKHMDTDSSISNEHISPVPMGASLPANMSASSMTNGSSVNEDRFASNASPLPPPPPPTSSLTNNGRGNPMDHHASPNHRYTSLPNSPVSDFGYSPYSNYPYPSLSGYPPMMGPPHAPANASNISPYAHAVSMNSNPMPSPYFQNDQPHHHHPPPPPPPNIYDNGPPGFPNEKMKADMKHANYWHQSNEVPRMNHPQEHYPSNGNMYMSSPASTPYGRPPHEDAPGNAYSSSLDAGRPQ